MPADIRRETREADSPSASRFIARIEQVEYAAPAVEVARPAGA
ncbi:hypothetical protein [Pelomonas sp. Root1237]|nr:hypothetical protein [Pelomonas sp. Root1237]